MVIGWFRQRYQVGTFKGVVGGADDMSFTLTGNWSKAGQGGFMGGTVVPFIDQDDTDDPWTLQETDLKGANQNDQITKAGSGDFSWNTKFGAVSFTPSYSKSSSEGAETSTSGGGGGAPPSSASMAMNAGGVSTMQTTTTSTTNYGKTSNVQKGAVKTSYMDFGGSYSMMVSDPRTYAVNLSVKF
jgi:hypothetical protein